MGKSDPIAVVSFESRMAYPQEQETSCIRDTLDPVWNQDLAFLVTDSAWDFSIKLFDIDGSKRSDTLGTVKVKIPPFYAKIEESLMFHDFQGSIQFSCFVVPVRDILTLQDAKDAMTKKLAALTCGESEAVASVRALVAGCDSEALALEASINAAEERASAARSRAEAARASLQAKAGEVAEMENAKNKRIAELEASLSSVMAIARHDPSPPAGTEPGRSYKFYCKATGGCLECTGINHDSVVRIAPSSDSPDQVFTLVWHDVFSSYSIRHASKEFSLDVSGASRDDGARLILWETHRQPNQNFRLVACPQDPGFFYILSAHCMKAITYIPGMGICKQMSFAQTNEQK
jgi:hypothetical protein